MKYKALVIPAEVMEVSEHTWPDNYDHAATIGHFLEDALREKYSDADLLFNKLCLIHAVFEAGRMQGIREERIKYKERRCKHAL